MLRLGIGAALVVALLISGWYMVTEYGDAREKIGFDRGVSEVRAALKAQEDRDVSAANAAESELAPTPADIIALIGICNSDPACRNRGQP